MTATTTKALLIFALFTIVALGNPLDNAKSQYNLFQNWTTQHGKQYGVDETPIRYAAWKNNYDAIQQHNAQNLSWQLGLNEFSDMTPEEFSALHLGFLNTPSSATNTNSDAEHVAALLQVAVNTSLDWRNKSIVTPIKNQGSCGSCWAFSTTGALEGLYALNKSQLLSFSEQQLVDCSSSYGNQGCNGGMYTGAFSYTAKEGIELETSYPYTGKSGTCQYSSSKAVFKNSAYKSVPAKNATLLQAAVNLQPISVAIEADQQAFQSYKSGIISSNCGTNLDHAVLVVGYGVSNGVNYWIVKNSWGTSWGEAGYVQIASGSQNSGAGVCGINSQPAYPTL